MTSPIFPSLISDHKADVAARFVQKRTDIRARRFQRGRGVRGNERERNRKYSKIHTEPEVKHRLRQTTDEADALNAVGVPTIVVQGFDGKKHAIWGSDRMGIVGFLIQEKYHGPLTEMSKY